MRYYIFGAHNDRSTNPREHRRMLNKNNEGYASNVAKRMQKLYFNKLNVSSYNMKKIDIYGNLNKGDYQ